MTYRLLALDLDGTVLDHDITIHPDVITAVKEVQSKGVIVTIATGRMYHSTLPYAQRLGITAPLICYQGALVRDPATSTVISHSVLGGPLAAEVVAMLLAEDIFVITYCNEQLWVREDCEELQEYLRWHPEGAEVIFAPDLAASIAVQSPTKILFAADPLVVQAQLARISVRFGDVLEAVRTQAVFGEVTVAGSSKGAALAQLAAHYGIAREEVVAIGDHDNDVSMVKWAGLGLAMGNAVPALKQIADGVVPTVREAGVAWAIRTYLL